MPGPKFSGTLYLRRSKLRKLKTDIEKSLGDAEVLASEIETTTSDSDHSDSARAVSEYQQKLSNLLEVVQLDLCAYDDACEDVASALESLDLEDSEEDRMSEISSYSDSSILWSRTAQTLRRSLHLSSQSTPSTSVKSEPRADGSSATQSDAIEQRIKQLIQISQTTQQQTQSFIAAQTAMANQQQQYIQQSQSTVLTQNMPGSSTPQQHTTNLPKLHIPKFSGDILKWFEFSDMFKASIASRNLSDVEKFSYLKSLLEGPALDTIAGLPLSSANYKVAETLLSDRFGKKQTCINAHYTALRDLQPASNQTTSLRTLIDQLDIHMRSLEALGENITQAIFISIITNKLPRHTLAQLELKKGSSDWTVTSLCTHLREYVVAHEAADRQSSQQPSDSGPFTSSSRVSDPITSSAHVLATTSIAKKCVFCKKSHFSDECQEYPDIESRKKQAKSHCFLCLSAGHSTSSCKSTRYCYHCRSYQHHRSLCPDKFGLAAGDVSSPQSSRVAASPTNTLHTNTSVAAQDQQQDEISACTTVCTPTSNTIMQTALVTLINMNTCDGTEQQPLQARLLLDTGSNKSFVSQSFQEKAKFTVLGQEKLLIGSFGSKKRKSVVSDVVRVTFSTTDGSPFTMVANTHPQITAPVRQWPVDSKHLPTLKSLTLAEPLSDASHLPIDILIGLDHYYDIVSDQHLRLGDGMILIQSTVGFIRTGPVSCQITQPSSPLVLSCDAQPDIDISRFWNFEEIGTATTSSSDSQVVDQFCQSVSVNRVDAIKSVPDLTVGYVQNNPAGLPSRGVTASFLQDSSLVSPEWLKDTCPVTALPSGEGPSYVHVAQEVPNQGSKDSVVHRLANLSLKKKKSDAHINPPFGIDYTRFPSFSTLVLVFALCLCFLSSLLKAAESPSGPVTASEINRAKQLWSQPPGGAPAPFLCDNVPQFILAHSGMNEAY